VNLGCHQLWIDDVFQDGRRNDTIECLVKEWQLVSVAKEIHHCVHIDVGVDDTNGGVLREETVKAALLRAGTDDEH
jgi:hypothetical protein